MTLKATHFNDDKVAVAFVYRNDIFTHWSPFRDSELCAPFTKWADNVGINYFLSPEGSYVIFNDESDAILAYMSFQ